MNEASHCTLVVALNTLCTARMLISARAVLCLCLLQPPRQVAPSAWTSPTLPPAPAAPWRRTTW